METFKDPWQVKSRLEDLHPSVFDNPAYKISDTGKWLEHIAHGDPSVGQYCRIFNDLQIRLLVFLFRFPAALILGRPEPSNIHPSRAKTQAARIRVSFARSPGPSGGDVVVSGVPEDLQ
jgi:hypothetical protein